MPPEVSGSTPPAPAVAAPLVKPPIPGPPRNEVQVLGGPQNPLTPADVNYDGSVYFSENAKWIPGKIVQLSGADRQAMAIIAAADGRIVSVRLADVRHGVKEPESLPHLHAILPGGKRRPTIKLGVFGKWIVASPDGIVKGEYDTEDEAKAKHASLELPAPEPPPKQGQWHEASKAG